MKNMTSIIFQTKKSFNLYIRKKKAFLVFKFCQIRY